MRHDCIEPNLHNVKCEVCGGNLIFVFGDGWFCLNGHKEE